MIDDLLKIIDRVIALLQNRKGKKQAIFKELVEPCYRDMELVHKDYYASFTDFAELLASKIPESELLRMVKEKKKQLKPLRTKVHAMSVEFNTIYFSSDGDVGLFFSSCRSYFTAPTSRYEFAIDHILGANSIAEQKKAFDWVVHNLDYAWDEVSRAFACCKAGSL